MKRQSTSSDTNPRISATRRITNYVRPVQSSAAEMKDIERERLSTAGRRDRERRPDFYNYTDIHRDFLNRRRTRNHIEFREEFVPQPLVVARDHLRQYEEFLNGLGVRVGLRADGTFGLRLVTEQARSLLTRAQKREMVEEYHKRYTLVETLERYYREQEEKLRDDFVEDENEYS